MTLTIDPKLEARIREKAEAEGLSVEAYVERLVGDDQTAEEELPPPLLAGLYAAAKAPQSEPESGPANAPGPIAAGVPAMEGC